MLYCFAVQLTGFIITLKLYIAVLTICTMREHFSLPTQCICECHVFAITHSESPHLQQYLLAVVFEMYLFSMRQELNLCIHYLDELRFKVIRVFSPTDAQLDIIKNNFKFALKFTLKGSYMFRCEKHHPQGVHYLGLAKVTIVKMSQNTEYIKMVGTVWKSFMFTSMVKSLINTSRNERVTLQVYDTCLQMFLFFGLRGKDCLTRSTLSSDTRGRPTLFPLQSHPVV